jgi:hypothetical protein
MIRTLLFVPLVAWTAYSQTKTPEELGFSFNGAAIAIHTVSSASQSPVSTSGAVSCEDGIAYRIVLDPKDKPLFAYQLEVRKGPLNTVRITIKPADPEKLRANDWLKGKVIGDIPTIAATREFPPLRLGDEVHVDIMYNPKTGEKLSDVLRPVVLDAQEPAPKSQKVFAGPQFSWEGVKVAIGRKVIADRSGNWMIGEAIMMRVPGHGEYYLALRPPAGFPFQPSGWVDRNVLRFPADGEQVEITGRSNLLMKSDTGTVWVYHVAEARAKGRSDSVDITCSGDVDLLMHPKD